MQPIVTIERHITEQEREHPGATGVFSALLYNIALAAKIIARETTQAGLTQILGLAGQINVQGEQQMKLDVFAHETMVRMNSFAGRLTVMASEEDENIIPIPPEYSTGRYVLIFDPLDGSSNINVNVSIGTIFGVCRRLSERGPGTLNDCLQKRPQAGGSRLCHLRPEHDAGIFDGQRRSRVQAGPGPGRVFALASQPSFSGQAQVL